MKLVMTLLVRDEQDVLEENIKFHLAQGVDFFVVIDNGSVDGTLDTLKKYKNKGCLTYKIIQKHTYEQDKWVTMMAKLAIEKHKATHIIHCDADEFWLSDCLDLKRTIIKDMNTDVMRVSVRNYLPPNISNNEKLFSFNNFTYWVAKTKLCPGNVDDRVSSDLLMYEYPKKIVTNFRIKNIGYGNDSVKSKNATYCDTKHITIHHFPIRSYLHFKRKVVNGGSSYEKNPVNDPSIGWHWKSWYRIYKKGGIKKEYLKLTRCNNLNNLVLDGTLKKHPPTLLHKYKYFMPLKFVLKSLCC